MADDTTYSAAFQCTNCGHHGKVTLDKGCAVADERCPNCECFCTLVGGAATQPQRIPVGLHLDGKHIAEAVAAGGSADYPPRAA